MTDFKVVNEPNKNLLVSVILDQSGSMTSCRQSTINGFNEYIQTLRETQKREGGTIGVTLTKFSGELAMRAYSGHLNAGPGALRLDESKSVQIIYEAKEIERVPELTEETYVPSGNTPLYDAIGRTITATQQAIASQNPQPRVLMLIITDGEENASVEFKTPDSIRSLILEREAAGWQFVYLGTDHNAWTASSNIGLSATRTASYAKDGTKKMFRGLAASTTRYYASADSLGADQDFFLEQERASMSTSDDEPDKVDKKKS